MSNPFLIRDGLKQDIAVCMALDNHYETDYVWQMTFQPDTNHQSVSFRTERLPRVMPVEYPVSKKRMELALFKDQCFLVAAKRQDQSDILGFLTMRQDPVHKIALVQDIVVATEHRRRKIGTRLIKIAQQWAKEHQLHQFTVETQTKNYPAIMFCEKIGLSFCGFNDQYYRNQDIALFFGQTIR